MICKIKDILNSLKVSAYKILENKISSEEMFFIKKDLDMTRSKEVHSFKVTVYKDFEEDNKKYRGASTFDIHPTMGEKDIIEIIKDNYFAAGFVKNKYFNLPQRSKKKSIDIIVSEFSKMNLIDWMQRLSEALYKEDNMENGGINSAEIFLSKVYKRIINSEGIDVNFETYNGMIEFITFWKAEEEIELYKMLNFSDFDPKYIEDSVKEMLLLSKERSEARSMVSSGKYKVILKDDAVKEVLKYYTYNSNAEAVYNEISDLKVGGVVQGKNVTGDLVSLSLDPNLENSIYSAPYDDDGVTLEKVNIYDKGILNKYHGDFRHSFYLKTESTGNIKNVVFGGGSKCIEDMKKDPYLELVSFSDFQLDILTGDFGGEIRLGFLFDGQNKVTFTGGSVAGNIKNVQNKMCLSKELQKSDGFVGPEAIEMFDVTVAGK